MTFFLLKTNLSSVIPSDKGGGVFFFQFQKLTIFSTQNIVIMMTYLEIMGAWQTILLLIFVFVGVLPTIIALVDILKSDFTGNNKIVWVLVVLLANFFGAILYFLIGKQQKIKS